MSEVPCTKGGRGCVREESHLYARLPTGEGSPAKSQSSSPMKSRWTVRELEGWGLPWAEGLFQALTLSTWDALWLSRCRPQALTLLTCEYVKRHPL